MTSRVPADFAAPVATASQRARSALDSTVARALLRIGRRIGDRGGQIGRIGRDPVERAEVRRQRLREVVNDRSYTLVHAVEDGVALGQPGQRRLQFDADDGASWQARGQAETHSADAGAEIEHARAGRRIDGGGQQHGVDGDAVTARGLQHPHAAAQQGVFGRNGFHARDHVTTSCRNNRTSRGDYLFNMATVVSLEGKRKAPSLEPLLSLCAHDMAQVDREIVARMRSPVALIPELANHLVGAGGKRMRPLADGRCGAAVRLCRRQRPPHQARDLRRVHPFRHPAARRRGRCQRASARQAVGQLGVGRQGLGAGGRLPVHALLRADGRCRLARDPGRAVARLLDHRRGRGAAARQPARHQHARGDLSRGHQGQDRQAVRGGGRGRRHGGRPQRARARARWKASA